MSTIFLENINKRIEHEMKTGDSIALNTFRGLKAAIEKARTDKRNIGKELDYEAIVRSELKTYTEFIDIVTKQGKQEEHVNAIQDKRYSISLLQALLPKQMDKMKIQKIVRQVMKEQSINDKKQKGILMKHLMPHVKGKADGKLVNSVVDEFFDLLDKKLETLMVD